MGVEARAAKKKAPHYVLRLFVTGTTPKSLRAIRNLRAICEEYVPDRYDLEIVDIYQQPELAAQLDLVAAPTLVKQLPEPIRRVVGDLSDTEKVLGGLEVRKQPTRTPTDEAQRRRR